MVAFYELTFIFHDDQSSDALANLLLTGCEPVWRRYGIPTELSYIDVAEMDNFLEFEFNIEELRRLVPPSQDGIVSITATHASQGKAVLNVARHGRHLTVTPAIEVKSRFYSDRTALVSELKNTLRPWTPILMIAGEEMTVNESIIDDICATQTATGFNLVEFSETEAR